jgi:aldehyde dehydrogenase (NAD+)
MQHHRWVEKEAGGVVAAIIAYNYPNQLALAKLAPALAAGNTVVLKPAPDTPWCAAEVGRIIAEKTDFPPGVINIVTAADQRIGALLAQHPRVDVVSCTGSTATGRSVMAAAAATIKKVFLELGGKSAFVVLDDADLAAACAAAASTVTTHAGQGCALTTRLLVPRDRSGEALDSVASAMSRIPVGDPRDPKTRCGPLISARQRDRVQSYLDLAIAEGGTFHCGGERPAGLDRGFFIAPTVIAGLTNDTRTAREEIFGPVLVVLAHDGDADAVRIANDSPYGLSATVFGSGDRAARVAAELRAGTVNVNGGMWYSADVPFGGYKQSGIGREMGLAGFEEYLETKAVATAVTATER